MDVKEFWYAAATLRILMAKMGGIKVPSTISGLR
jgi:hypothetical protein